MTIRIRKLVGTVVLLVFLVIYAFAATKVGVTLLDGASKAAELAYYVVAGFAWTLPAGLLVSWMSRPDAPPGSPGRY